MSANSAPVTQLQAPPRFDAHQVDAFTRQASAAQGPIVVDLGAVRFIDVAGLNTLLETRANVLERGHEMFVSEPSQAARITFELAGLAEAFPAVELLEAA